jgi:hypothetical protein
MPFFKFSSASYMLIAYSIFLIKPISAMPPALRPEVSPLSSFRESVNQARDLHTLSPSNLKDLSNYGMDVMQTQKRSIASVDAALIEQIRAMNLSLKPDGVQAQNLASVGAVAVKAEVKVLDSYRRPQGLLQIARSPFSQTQSEFARVSTRIDIEGEKTVDALSEMLDLIKVQNEWMNSRLYICMSLQRIEESMWSSVFDGGHRFFSYDHAELRRCTQFLLNLPEDDHMRHRYRGFLPTPILVRNPAPINDTTLSISDSELRNAG